MIEYARSDKPQTIFGIRNWFDPAQFKSAQARFLLVSIPLIIAVTMAAFAFLQVFYYHSERTSLLDDQRKLAATQSLLLAIPLRFKDDTTAKRLLVSMLANPVFAGAEVIDKKGNTVVAVGEPVVGIDASLVHEQNITYADNDGAEIIGQLRMRVSDTRIWRSMQDRFIELTIMLAAAAVTLGFGIHLAYRHAIGSPLQKLTSEVRDQDWDGMSRPRRLTSGTGDELGVLTDTLDHSRLQAWELRHRLARANSELESLVDERTQELTTALAELTQKKHEVERLANRDRLTDLPNRRALFDHLDQRLSLPDAERFTLGIVDLDRFKQVNDTLGHPVGDELLKAIAQRLTDCTDDVECVARLGGDEFAIIIPDRTGRDAAKAASRIVNNCNRKLTIGDHTIHPGLSMGICGYPTDAKTREDLMINADIALYEAKEAGRGCFKQFDAITKQRIYSEKALADDLRRALENGDLTVHYQPQFSLADHSLTGFEALVRWPHETRGLVSPGEFLPVAEKYNMALGIGRFVAKRVAQDLKDWARKGFSPKSISINLHPHEVLDPQHVRLVMNTLMTAPVKPEQIVFEITEDCVIGRDASRINDLLVEIRKKGFELSLDDFGTGYASLSHLRSMPINEVKLDRQFIEAMDDPDGAAIVYSIGHLVTQLGLRLVAEGIERQQQAARLMPVGGVVAQGYLFGRPAHADSVIDIIAAGEPVSLDVEDLKPRVASKRPKLASVRG